ncbi:putative ribosome biosynthesis protein GDT1 [Sporobolomyces salmoneus]|uniref:putative ribosome biosynthesis protein GDT1 n=1 Tax=Sporobolomyces salmoneus TaxID=183962 RepID=UPI00317A2167
MLDLSLPTSFEGFTRSISVILVSEIGDRTFIIAAILSMRHSRAVIYAGALSALATMSLLSALLGTIVPSLLPKKWTTLAAAVLFFFFGARMLQEGLEMEGGHKGKEKMEEEMREVQKEVEEAVAEDGTGSIVDMEEGIPLKKTGEGAEEGEGNLPLPASSRSGKKAEGGIVEGAKNLVQLCFSPIFVQAFILTFLAEWGDRSQITTIALAAAHNVWIVTLGTTLGHSVCTLGAVMGGRWISQHISIKHVMLSGAVLFLIFGIVYGYEFYNFVDEPLSIGLTPSS